MTVIPRSMFALGSGALLSMSSLPAQTHQPSEWILNAGAFPPNALDLDTPTPAFGNNGNPIQTAFAISAGFPEIALVEVGRGVNYRGRIRIDYTVAADIQFRFGVYNANGNPNGNTGWSGYLATDAIGNSPFGSELYRIRSGGFNSIFDNDKLDEIYIAPGSAERPLSASFDFQMSLTLAEGGAVRVIWGMRDPVTGFVVNGDLLDPNPLSATPGAPSYDRLAFFAGAGLNAAAIVFEETSVSEGPPLPPLGQETPASFQITEFVLLPAQDAVRIGWQSSPGTLYRIERSIDPAVGWETVDQGLPAAGGFTFMELYDQELEEPRRFYRVVRE